MILLNLNLVIINGCLEDIKTVCFEAPDKVSVGVHLNIIWYTFLAIRGKSRDLIKHLIFTLLLETPTRFGT